MAKNAACAGLPQRLVDVKFWVEQELALPEEDQASLLTLDRVVRSFLGEMRQRSINRAKRDVALTVVQNQAREARCV